MSKPRLMPLALCATLALPVGAMAPSAVPAWTDAQSRALLEQTRELWLDPDLSSLSPGERSAVDDLIAAGRLVQQIYERQLHPDAEIARARLQALPVSQPRARLEALYRLSNGPVVTTLDNQRVPFLPVAPLWPGKGVYAADTTVDQVETFLQERPRLRDTLLGGRSVLRRADAESAQLDLAVLDIQPVLDVLHPGLRAQLESLRQQPQPDGFYALPYAVAYADAVREIHLRLNDAARAVAGDDPQFAGYLRNRSRDLLSDDYESGDAAWVTGTAHFGRLNAQIGAYETYDDELFGTRTFFSLSILKKREAQTAKLLAAVGSNLQQIEDALPYESARKVRTDIPIGAYDVIADFGQSRGGNTASILPNDPLHASRYGRVILLRANIMQHPQNVAIAERVWAAATVPAHHDDLGPDGGLQRTLWHEIGHYLGVDRTRDGRLLDVALGANANLLEEMKADLVALHAAPLLHAQGYYDDAGLRAVQASGILRVLQRVAPRRDQPYAAMQLMQWNFFMARGLLRYDRKRRQLAIDYAVYAPTVAALLQEVLALQAKGDAAQAEAFIARWFRWDPKLHEPIAAAIRATLPYRFASYRYAALDGPDSAESSP